MDDRSKATIEIIGNALTYAERERDQYRSRAQQLEQENKILQLEVQNWRAMLKSMLACTVPETSDNLLGITLHAIVDGKVVAPSYILTEIRQRHEPDQAAHDAFELLYQALKSSLQ